MSNTARVLSALNFLTGEGVNHFPEGYDGRDLQALIEDYFNPVLSQNDDDSDEECDHRNEGKNLTLIAHKTLCQYIADLPGTTHNETMSEGTK